MNGNWKGQMLELCELLGFELDNDIVCYFSDPEKRWSLKRGRSHAQWQDGRKWVHSGPVDWRIASVTVRDGESEESCMKRFFKALSGRELVVRGTSGKEPTPFGYVVTRTEQHIKLPDFGSVEELKLKLAAEGS